MRFMPTSGCLDRWLPNRELSNASANTLKERCRERNLSPTGKKQNLVKRLHQCQEGRNAPEVSPSIWSTRFSPGRSPWPTVAFGSSTYFLENPSCWTHGFKAAGTALDG
jgi:hypothetical protein